MFAPKTARQTVTTVGTTVTQPGGNSVGSFVKAELAYRVSSSGLFQSAAKSPDGE